MDAPEGGFNRSVSRILTFFNRPWKVVLLFDLAAAAAAVIFMGITGGFDGVAFLFVLVSSTAAGYFLARLIFMYRDMQQARRDHLQRVNAELEARNKELEAFSYTVAHDLKTPLATILGYTYLLREHPGERASNPARVGVEIEGAAVKMSEIIDSILVLASAGIKQVDPAPMQMDVVFDNAAKRLKPMIEAYGAEIEAPAAWPAAIGYEPWVEEALVNLVSNAIKYGGSPPRVTLGYDKRGDNVRYCVCDNGPGIPAEDQEKLFMEFTRLQQNRAEGHGLGLAIVRRVVERLGGEYGVESEPGEGSTFFFSLPACD